MHTSQQRNPKQQQQQLKKLQKRSCWVTQKNTQTKETMWKRRYGEEKHTSKGDNVEERKLVKKNTHRSTQCGRGKMASKTKICDLKFELCVGFSSFG
jgi:hypothetical protein